MKLDADLGKDHHTIHTNLLKSIVNSQDLGLNEQQKGIFLKDVESKDAETPTDKVSGARPECGTYRCRCLSSITDVMLFMLCAYT